MYYLIKSCSEFICIYVCNVCDRRTNVQTFNFLVLQLIFRVIYPLEHIHTDTYLQFEVVKIGGYNYLIFPKLMNVSIVLKCIQFIDDN